MDFTALAEHFVLIVVLACLIVGYIIKHSTFLRWIPNDDIPVILAAIGCGMNLAVSGLTIEAGVYGALMGLASTGMHQAFSRWVEGKTDPAKDTGE